MIQRRLMQHLVRSLIAMSVPLSVLILVLPARVGDVSAADVQADYFYLKEAAPENLTNSCSSVFDTIAQGKEEDVGLIVKSLKTINVNYLLDDYDNSLGSDRRKKVLTLEDLLAEVENNKRGIYCKIELAIYMQGQNYRNDPVYGDLLNEAFLELDETYASAKKSFARKNYARASYAFDLIAPYKDSYQLALQASKSRKDNSVEKSAAMPVASEISTASDTDATANEAGPIAMAVMAAQDSTTVAAAGSPGPITMAAKPGPITAAAIVLGADSSRKTSSGDE